MSPKAGFFNNFRTPFIFTQKDNLQSRYNNNLQPLLFLTGENKCLRDKTNAQAGR